MKYLIFVMGFIFATPLFAQQDQYLDLLKITQKYAQEKKELRSVDGAGMAINAPANANGIASSALLISNFHPHFFAPEQIWTVAVSPNDGSMARMTSQSLGESSHHLPPLLFEYKVLSVDASTKTARISIQQKKSEQDTVADTHIDHLIIQVDENFSLTKKEVYYSDGRAPRSIAVDGAENPSSGFDLYPIILPNPSRPASYGAQNYEEAPALPTTLSSYLSRSALSDLMGKRNIELQARSAVGSSSTILDFRFSDLYARPIRAIWGEADSWPAYVESSTGVSLLLR